MSNIALTDWLTFVPAGEIRQQRAYVDLPAFSYAAAGSVGDPSIIVAQFNFSASRDFYLLTRPTKPTGVNYGLCIRYRVGETVYRYKLWEDAGFRLSSATPSYAKQLIKKNFVLEVWNFATVAASQTTSVRMLSSVRSVPTDYRAIADYALAVGAEFTDFNQTNVAPTTRSTTNLVADYTANISQCEIDFSDKVQTMYDQSGNGRHLTQGTAGARPAHSLFAPPTPVLTFDTVLFDGISKYLAWGGTPPSFAAGWSVYLIGCVKPVWTSDAFLFASGDSLFNGLGFKTAATSPGLKLAAEPYLSNPTIGSVPNNEVGLIEGFYNGSDAFMFGNSFLPGTFNGVVAGFQEAPGYAVSAAPSFWSVGGAVATSFTSLQLARLMIYNTLHNSTQRTLIRQYLEGLYFGALTLPLTFNSGGAWLDNV
tara:strand:- start:181 stop:1449 length:1269 start_codon:yes stop_codon:yes gene_type:complete